MSRAVGLCKAVEYLLHAQALKQTLLPRAVFDCKYLSRKICFNVLNYVFSLIIFNFYCLVNIQWPCHNASHSD